MSEYSPLMPVKMESLPYNLPWRHRREYSRSSTLSLSSTVVVVGDQRHAPAALPPGNRPVSIVQETVPVWTCVENLV